MSLQADIVSATIQPRNAILGWAGLLRRRCLLGATMVFMATAAHAEPLKVVTTFTILADLTHQVAGDHAQVTSLVGPDGDAHVYEPTPSDVRSLAAADIVIINGLGLEGWFDRLIASSGFKGRVVVASEGIEPIMVGGAPDPHAWQSVGNGKLYAVNIANALVKADSGHAADYEKNELAYVRQLGDLDIWVRAQIDNVPKSKRVAITSHDALRYFAATYRVGFIAPLGLSTSGEVSAGSMAKLVDQMRDRQVHAVFLENMTDPRLIQQLVKDAGAVIGGTLYSDSLSPPTGPAPTYTAMFHHNVDTIVKAMAHN